MAVNLQRHTGRDLGQLESTLREWFAHRSSPLGTVKAVRGARYIEGAGSANESILADCVTERDGRIEDRGIVIRLTVPSIAAYLDVDLEQQARTLDWVRRNTEVPVPEVYGVDTEGAALGAPFLIFECLEGRVPNDYPPYNVSGLVKDMHPEGRRRLWRSALDTMCELHTADASSIDFLPGGLDAGLVALVDYWQRTFDWVEERVALTDIAPYRSWLLGNIPSDSPRGLSWGDARLGNMMFAGPRCVAVLDWEMASLGGPLVDLAWWLMFDVNHSRDSGIDRLEGLGRREETIRRWEERTGLSVRNLQWHEVFSLFQLALLRANAFEGRRRMGLPVPDDNDPRSVERLIRRMDAVLSR